MDLCGLHHVGALTTAEVYMQVVEGNRVRTAELPAGIGPAASVIRGLELYGTGIALKTLLEDEVLGKTGVHAVHGAPLRLELRWTGRSHSGGL